MEPINFVYWLQGYLEISGGKPLNAEQVKIVQDHIELVLEKKTPNRVIMPNPDITGFPFQLHGDGTVWKSPSEQQHSVRIGTTNNSDLSKLLNHQLPPASC
jgi:hypothetical protein